jgi:hypothetical protein
VERGVPAGRRTPAGGEGDIFGSRPLGGRYRPGSGRKEDRGTRCIRGQMELDRLPEAFDQAVMTDLPAIGMQIEVESM